MINPGGSPGGRIRFQATHAPALSGPERRGSTESQRSEKSSPPRIRFVGARPEIRLAAPRSLQLDLSPHVEAVPELHFDLGQWGKATATVTGCACETLVKHCSESNVHGRELGGLLVGYATAKHSPMQTRRRLNHTELIMTDVVPIRTFDSSGVHLCFTVEEWNRAEEYVRINYAAFGKTTLGWYHTHPDQGIFFSSKDQTAHEVFTEPHQVALVIDPRNMEAGLFHWVQTTSRSVAGPVRFSLTGSRR